MTTTTNSMFHVKLSQLAFGHDPRAGAEINSRVSNRTVDIPRMAAMLNAQGQLYPLIVVLNPAKRKDAEGIYFAVDGNRRLAAMKEYWEADADVNVYLLPAGQNALEASLAANTNVPQHPVDRFRTYVRLMDEQKLSPEDLARRMGITSRAIAQSLALGRLHDEVLDAWMLGEINADSAEVFTLQPDKAQQAKMLKAARKTGDWALEPHQLRRQILGKREDVAALLTFVGVAEYEEAGGKFLRDLFNDRHVALDVPLVKTLAATKLEQECATLVATGWAWAKPKAAMPQGWHYNGAWDRLPQPDKKKLPPIIVKELKTIEAAEHDDPDDAESMRDSILSLAMATLYSDADKAKTGCVLEVDQHGRLMITAGVSERKAKAAAKPKAKAKGKAAAPAEAKEAAISAKLALTLSQELTQAAADTLRDCKDPFLVVKMVTAALITTYGGPLKVKTEGMLTPQMSEVEAFDEAWVRLAKYKTMEEIITGPLATALARGVDLRSSLVQRDLLDREDDSETAAFVLNLPATALNANTRKAFHPDHYFASAPGAFAVAALEEMAVQVPKGYKKAALATLAAEMAATSGWLPPQMRAHGYALGSAAPAEKAAPKAKAAKGGKK